MAEKIQIENQNSAAQKKLAIAEAELESLADRLTAKELQIDQLQAQLDSSRNEIKAKDKLFRELQEQDLKLVASLSRDQELKDLKLQNELLQLKTGEF